MWPTGGLWAGGLREPPSPEQEQAEKAKERWQRKGLRAAPEMIAAFCTGNEWLRRGAREALTELGPAALPGLARASAKEHCHPAVIMVDIVCASGKGETELSAMLRDRNHRVFTMALFVLIRIGEDPWRCPAAAPVVERVTPRLRPWLRSRTGQDLQNVLRTAASGGPAAVSLVPDVIPLLDKDEATGNSAAVALRAIGPGAQLAVPALRARLQRGDGGRVSTIGALGGIGPAARPALPDLARLLASALRGAAQSQHLGGVPLGRHSRKPRQRDVCLQRARLVQSDASPHQRKPRGDHRHG